MLTCHNLTLQFNNKIIFKKLGFSLVPGSIMILKGKNGSGKTSLLRTIGGLIRPSCGEILWRDKRQNNHISKNCPFILNYVSHHNALKKSETVIDTLAFWCNLYQSPMLLMAAISYFRLGDVCDLPVAKLSAGMQRRVALARLVACYSHIWLLDEPDTNLDQEAKKLLYGLINVRLSEGGMVIMASHEDAAFKSCVLDMNDFTDV